ncbi:MAG: hypothetical protein HRT54_06725 [Colwellia sp.]|nr:hypothetical protein [Colwellia sp.]
MNIDYKKFYVKHSRISVCSEIENFASNLIILSEIEGALLPVPQKHERLSTMLDNLDLLVKNKESKIKQSDLLLYLSCLNIIITTSDKFTAELVKRFSKTEAAESCDLIFLANMMISFVIHDRAIDSLVDKIPPFLNAYFIDYQLLHKLCIECDSKAIEKLINAQKMNGIIQTSMMAIALICYQSDSLTLNKDGYLKILEASPHFFAGYCLDVFKLRQGIEDIDLASYHKAYAKYFLDERYAELFTLKAMYMQWERDLNPIVRKSTQVINVLTSGLSSTYSKVKYAEKIINSHRKNSPEKKISFVTSMYKGDDWVKGFMENMVRMDSFNHSEMLIISANSPGNEFSIIEPYLYEHDNIYYIELDFDPGLYEVWNIGCRVATSSLLSNANLDDRKAIHFINEHLKVFEENPDVTLVSAQCLISKTPEMLPENIGQDNCETLSYYTSPQIYGFYDLFVRYFSDEGKDRVVVRNIPHCMPVWRKKLHEEYGYFNEKCGGPTADFEFWMRCTSNGELFYNINKPLGVYYFSDVTTYSARQENSLDEVIEKYILSMEVL